MKIRDAFCSDVAMFLLQSVLFLYIHCTSTHQLQMEIKPQVFQCP